MRENGETTDKMSVYIKAHDINDPDVKSLFGEYNEQLSRIPEPLQTNDALEKIFHDMVGTDGQGYCKTYGTCVTRSVLYPKEVSPSQASSSLTVEKITQQVRHIVTQEIEKRLTVEIEQRITNKLKIEFEQVSMDGLHKIPMGHRFYTDGV